MTESDDTDKMPAMIVPMAPRFLRGFHAAVDSVARERRYLAMVEAPPLSAMRNFVRNGARAQSIHYVALSDGTVVGWCDVHRTLYPSQRHSGTLGMGIVADHRGRGIGRGLLRATVDTADSLGLTRIELRVRTDNVPALHLYESFGFVVEGTCRQYLRLDGEDFDALLMARLR